MSPPDQPTVFSAADWNTKDPKLVEEFGSKLQPWTIYRASKSLAEKGIFYACTLSDVLTMCSRLGILWTA